MSGVITIILGVIYNKKRKNTEINTGLILIGAGGFYVAANFIRYYLHYFIGIKENSIFAMTVYDISIMILIISLYNAAVKIVIKKENKIEFRVVAAYLLQYAAVYQIVYYFYMEADYTVKNKFIGGIVFVEDIGLNFLSFFILIKTLKYLKKIEDRKLRERAYIVISIMILYVFISFLGIEDFYYDTIVVLYPLLNIYFICLGIKEYQKEESVKEKSEKEEIVVAENGMENFIKEYELTASEREILQLLYKGYTNAEIADLRKISINTVKRHVYNIFKKADVDNRIELIHMINET